MSTLFEPFSLRSLTVRNRIWLARLDAFAHDLFVLIAVGTKANSSSGDERSLRVVTPLVSPAAVPGERRS